MLLPDPPGRDFPPRSSFPGVPALITEQLFRDVLTAALTQLHGAVGGAAPFELLSLQGGVGIVRLDKR